MDFPLYKINTQIKVTLVKVASKVETSYYQAWESVVMEKPESDEKTWKRVWISAKTPQKRAKIRTQTFLHPKKPEFRCKPENSHACIIWEIIFITSSNTGAASEFFSWDGAMPEVSDGLYHFASTKLVQTNKNYFY